MMRSGNPALRADTFTKVGSCSRGNAMTIQGTVNKGFLLIALLLLSASWAWGNPATSAGLLFPALILGFILAIVTVFKKEWANITAPAYALVEGVLLGAISFVFEAKYSGIVFQAVGLTIGVFVCLLMAYKSRLIKATENFKLGIVAATGGICLLYFVNIVMGFFGASIPFIHQSGTFGIIFSLVVVVIAALNLVLDFDFIEKGAQVGAPKYMEWYGAFGLLVTLIWLYLEILRLLAKLNSRR
jgi:uncharacterized YccA/Bax inhibitor family protein